MYSRWNKSWPQICKPSINESKYLRWLGLRAIYALFWTREPSCRVRERVWQSAFRRATPTIPFLFNYQTIQSIFIYLSIMQIFHRSLTQNVYHHRTLINSVQNRNVKRLTARRCECSKYLVYPSSFKICDLKQRKSYNSFYKHAN